MKAIVPGIQALESDIPWLFVLCSNSSSYGLGFQFRFATLLLCASSRVKFSAFPENQS